MIDPGTAQRSPNAGRSPEKLCLRHLAARANPRSGPFSLAERAGTEQGRLRKPASGESRLKNRGYTSVTPEETAGQEAALDIGAWLRGLGLAQYEQLFRDNDVDSDLLPQPSLRASRSHRGGHRRPARGVRADLSVWRFLRTGVRRRAADRRGVAAAHSDVCRPRRLERTGGGSRPRGLRVAVRSYQDACAGAVASSAASSPSISATVCWPTSAGHGPVRMSSSRPSRRASPSSRRSPS
jgi:hypothetical protein